MIIFFRKTQYYNCQISHYLKTQFHLMIMFLSYRLAMYQSRVSNQSIINIFYVRLLKIDFYCTIQLSYTKSCDHPSICGKLNYAVNWFFCKHLLIDRDTKEYIAMVIIIILAVLYSHISDHVIKQKNTNHQKNGHNDSEKCT
jgi:hypothetical protein